MNLNIHFHILVTEGLWQQQDAKDLATKPEAKTKLQKLTAPNNDDIEKLTRHIKDRITRWLVQKGFASKTNSETATEFHSLEQQGFFADTEAIIGDLQAASIQSRLATGPNTGKLVRKLGQQIHLPFYSEFKFPRCFAVDGYSLHANTFCHENESCKLRRLIEYVARPPFANDRIALTRNGDVTLKLKKPFNDGTTHIVFTPLEFIEKLAALAPKPRVHLIRYAGAFARHAKIRPDVLVKARMGDGTDGDNSQ